MKNVLNFEMRYLSSNVMGNRWRGSGYVKGCSYFVEGCFLYHTKKEIARLLKNKILEKARRSAQ